MQPAHAKLASLMRLMHTATAATAAIQRMCSNYEALLVHSSKALASLDGASVAGISRATSCMLTLFQGKQWHTSKESSHTLSWKALTHNQGKQGHTFKESKTGQVSCNRSALQVPLHSAGGASHCVTLLLLFTQQLQPTAICSHRQTLLAHKAPACCWSRCCCHVYAIFSKVMTA
jgi:hypothetical protein